MVVTEVWALPLARIKKYLEGFYEEMIYAEENLVKIGEVEIRLTKLPDNTIMKFPIPRTEIKIEGPEEAAEKIHHRFVMNFLSAGG